MRCLRARRCISDGLDGALPSRRAERLKAHLGTCETCRAYRDRVLRVQEGARLPSAPAADFWAGFERRLAAKIASAETSRRAGAFPMGVRHRLAWAAAAFLILAGLVTWHLLRRPEPALREAWIPYEDIVDPLAGEATPELEALVDREIRALIDEEGVPAGDVDAAGLPAADPLFWESLDDEDLRAVIAALETESGHGGPL